MPFPRRAARLTGYAVVMSFLVAGVCFGVFLFRDAVRGPLVRVHFPELATLAEGDPVVERGVTIGRVERITLTAGRPQATLRFFHHRVFPTDTRFVNLSHSLMGARKVWVIPGTSPASLDITQVQKGAFAPGLPETMHTVEELVARLAILRTTADSLLAAGAATALLEPLDAAHGLLNRVAASVEAGAATLDEGRDALRSAAHAAERMAHAVRDASPAADSAAGRVRALLQASVHAEATLAEALTTLESLAIALDDTTAGGRLLNDRGAYDSLLMAVRARGSVTRARKSGGRGDDNRIRPRR